MSGGQSSCDWEDSVARCFAIQTTSWGRGSHASCAWHFCHLASVKYESDGCFVREKPSSISPAMGGARRRSAIAPVNSARRGCSGWNNPQQWLMLAMFLLALFVFGVRFQQSQNVSKRRCRRSVPWVVQTCLAASSRACQERLSHAALSPCSRTEAGAVHMQILPKRDRPIVQRREWLRGGQSQVRPAPIDDGA